MPNRQVIQLYRPERVLQYIPRGTDLHAHGRLAPLHRLLWRWLGKMGALTAHLEVTVEYRRLVIKDEHVINRVAAALDGIHLRGEVPKEILMGPNAFAEMMTYPEMRDYSSPFSFGVQYEMGHSRRLFNLPVHVLPQMEGVLVR